MSGESFPVQRQLTSHYVLTWWKRWWSSWGLYYKGTNPIIRIPPSSLNHLPKASLFNTITKGLGFNTQWTFNPQQAWLKVSLPSEGFHFALAPNVWNLLTLRKPICKSMAWILCWKLQMDLGLQEFLHLWRQKTMWGTSSWFELWTISTLSFIYLFIECLCVMHLL